MAILVGAPIIADDFLAPIDDLTDRVAAIETGYPRAAVALSGSQSIPIITGTALNFGSESYDVGPIHSGSSSQLISPLDGLYQGMLYVVWETNTLGYRTIVVRANGSTDVAALKVEAEGTDAATMSIPWDVFLSAGDYVQAIVYYDAVSGPSSLNILGARMTMHYYGTTL